MIKKIWNISSWGRLFLFLAIVNLAGCGGGENASNVLTSGEGGTSGTGVFAASIAKGTISSPGGFSAGGINYSIDAATISFNGQSGGEAQLETGMVVNINGQVNADSSTGIAESIVFAYNIAGSIDTINLASKTINVLEHAILFDELTTFKNTLVDSLAVGDVILVSGFTDANGKILATYIEKPQAVFPEAILEGALSQIETLNKTFKLGGQLVDYSGAQLSAIPNNILSSGSLVRVTGSEAMITQGQQDTVVLATRVEGISSVLTGNPDEEVRIEGLISQITGPDVFYINGNTVRTSINTRYTNGVASDLTLDTRVFVNGTLDANGSINAENVRFILPTDVSIEARVDTIDPVASTLTMVGRTVIIDAFTMLQDSSSAGIQTFSMPDIVIGDRLKVAGLDDGQAINAIHIERVDALANNSQSILEGVVEDSIANPLFRVAGLDIDTSGLQEFSGFSQGGITSVTRNTFFASLQPQMIARITGDYLAGVLQPSHVEIVHCCNWEVYDSFGGFLGGGNDVTFTWDGTLNTDVLSNNVNATLSTNATIVGETSLAQDVRIFGPGTYVFDTGLDPSLSTNFGTTNLGGAPLNLTVGAEQIGMHGLFHFGMDGASTVCGKQTCNIDVVILWNINAVYAGSAIDDSNLGAKGRVFNLSSADGNADGIPGIPVVDGPFIGLSTVYNLNFTSP